MKDFIEKLKDVLYNGIDYIMMIVIVVAIVLIINWRIGGLFTKDSTDVHNNTSNETNNTENYEDDSNDNIDNAPVAEEDEPKIVNIEIPSGVYPSDIADILLSNGLIDSKEDFINKVVELGLESKLRSGSYEIPNNSSVEEVLDIITK